MHKHTSLRQRRRKHNKILIEISRRGATACDFYFLFGTFPYLKKKTKNARTHKYSELNSNKDAK